MIKRVFCLVFIFILIFITGIAPAESISISNISYASEEANKELNSDATPVEITAELTSINGSTSIENNDVGKIIISEKTTIVSGTTIKTGEGASAELSFTDGSGFKIEENTTLIIKKMQGVTIISDEGLPFSSIKSVVIELPIGKIYGDLAPAFYIIPNNETPVRVEVDMPWGIAGIRGTIWSNEVVNDTQTTTVFRGKVEVSSQSESAYITKGYLAKITPEDSSIHLIEKFTEKENEYFEKINNWVEKRESVIQNNEANTSQKNIEETNMLPGLYNNPVSSGTIAIPEPLGSTIIPESPEAAAKKDLPEVATKKNLPETAIIPDLNEAATKKDLPEVATKKDLPEAATKPDLPDAATNKDLPEAAIVPDLPNAAMDKVLPDSAANKDMPEAAIVHEPPDPADNKDLHEAATKPDLPDTATNKDLPEATAKPEPPDTATKPEKKDK